jgi:hypothetical protein
MECWSADSPKDYSNTRHPSSGSATVDFSTGDGRNEVSETACIRGKTVTFRLDTKEFEPAAHGEVQYDFHNPIVLWSMAGLEHGLQMQWRKETFGRVLPPSFERLLVDLLAQSRNSEVWLANRAILGFVYDSESYNPLCTASLFPLAHGNPTPQCTFAFL